MSNTKWWILKMTPEDTAENLYKQCQKLFPCWKSDLIDLSKITNDRSGNYTIEFSPNIEADEQWANISANDLPKDRQFITFPERLKLGIQYFKATGKHLDIEYWTLCAGSRGSDGDVPGCSWCDDEFGVYWYYPDYCSDNLRSRSAVSPGSLTPSDTLEVRVKNLEKQMSDLKKFLIF